LPVKREHVGLVLVIVGLVVVLAGAYLAYAAYKSYKPLKASPGGIEETISVTVMKLVDLAFKLAYIGVIVWAGGILLRNGIEAYKPPRPEEESK
jgi:hypothetical protein